MNVQMRVGEGDWAEVTVNGDVVFRGHEDESTEAVLTLLGVSVVSVDHRLDVARVDKVAEVAREWKDDEEFPLVAYIAKDFCIASPRLWMEDRGFHPGFIDEVLEASAHRDENDSDDG